MWSVCRLKYIKATLSTRHIKFGNSCNCYHNHWILIHEKSHEVTLYFFFQPDELYFEEGDIIYITDMVSLANIL